MPKAQLSYDLFEERVEFHQAINGHRAFSALDDFREHLRREYKYAELSDEVHDYLEKLRERFHEVIEENQAYDESF